MSADREPENFNQNSYDDLSALKVSMTKELKLRDDLLAADDGYEHWGEAHQTVMNNSRWIPTKSLLEFLDHVGSARGKTNCTEARLSLIGEIGVFLAERCAPGHVVFGPHRRFPENPHVRSDDEFWETQFDQIIKCLRCSGISDVDREFFLEQKLALMLSRVEEEAVSRDLFESSNNLLWRSSNSGESLSEFEKQQRVLQLQKALLDLRIFKQDFNKLIARIEARMNKALKTLGHDV